MLVITKSNKNTERNVLSTIEAAFPKAFIILSAYFSTIAIINPPMARRITASHAQNEYPWKKLEGSSNLQSLKTIPKTPERILNSANQMFRDQTENLLSLNSFSMNTPAKPEVQQKTSTENRPSAIFVFSDRSALDPDLRFTKTKPTPKMKRESHWKLEICFFKKVTLNIAAVMSFS